MALTKVYNRINWENTPSVRTPLNETNLNFVDYGLDVVDDRVIAMDTTKANVVDLYNMVVDVQYDTTNGIFTMTRQNGTQFTINTKLEKLAVNFFYNSTTEMLEITLDDGTIQSVDLSELINDYDFTNSSTISFMVDSSGKVSADVLRGSITADKLQPNFLADMQQLTNDANQYALIAKTWAVGDGGVPVAGGGTDTDNSKYYAALAKAYAGQASGTAINYLGDYNPAFTYAALDACYYLGSTWVAKVNNPTTTPQENTDWRYLAKGIDAQFKFILDVDYQALPPSKNTDGILYFIG